MLALFNGFEAALWWTVALIVAIKFARRQSAVRRTARWTVLWLVLFGISDCVEIFTGAWWRPWPLFALKGCCLAGLVWCGWRLLRAGRRARSGGI